MTKTKKLTVILTVLAIIASLVALTGCGNAEDEIYNKGYAESVNYDDGIIADVYEVKTFKDDGYKIYQPQANTDVVLIFYLGTAMSVDNYDSILLEIASHGISVVVPDNRFADLTYKTDERAYGMFDASSFVLGGHSQGGGAAIRRASENLETTKACMLFSPMISNDSSLKDTDLPVLFFEAQNDNILNSQQKNEVKTRMNGSCRYVLLEGANHMCYGKSDAAILGDGKNERDKSEIQTQVADECIKFLDSLFTTIG